MKYTEENITQLAFNEIFVFGSNEAGIHGAGAAYLAEKRFGAKRGQGFGPAGATFAIPTKDWNIGVLPLNAIKFYIDRFLYFIVNYPEYHYLITKLGCGLAGYEIKDIAPLFEGFVGLSNVSLPKEFVDEIESSDSLRRIADNM